MSTLDEQSRAELLASVFDLIRAQVPGEDAPVAESFARHYYAQVATEDLVDRNPRDLCGAAVSHWRHAHHFAGGTPSIKIHNPRPEEHGWQSTHTVIEIVSEDMPFLVDSITMEVNRQGLTPHLIIHPIMNIRRNADGCLLGGAEMTIQHQSKSQQTSAHARVLRARSFGTQIIGRMGHSGNRHRSHRIPRGMKGIASRRHRMDSDNIPRVKFSGRW